MGVKVQGFSRAFGLEGSPNRTELNFWSCLSICYPGFAITFYINIFLFVFERII